MSFSSLLEYCKVAALKDLLAPTEETVWKSITRVYSERFHVPLPQVRQMNPEEVISEVFEVELEGTDPIDNIENILDQIYTIEDPAYKVQKEENMEVFIKKTEKKEQKRLLSDKEKELFNREKLRPKNKPTGGSVDFSHLKNEK